MAKSSSKDMWQIVSQLETTLNEYFGNKAPQLPRNIKDIIVKIAPYLVILGVIVSIPAILALFGLSALLAPAMLLGGGWTIVGIVSLVTLIATVVLEALAIPGLFAKKKSAWNKLFWVSLIGIVSSLVSGNLVSLIVGTAINWYVLFQVRSYYR